MRSKTGGLKKKSFGYRGVGREKQKQAPGVAEQY
jgi:hypothetical protein